MFGAFSKEAWEDLQFTVGVTLGAPFLGALLVLAF